MSLVCLEVEEEDVPLVKTLLYLKSTLRTPSSKIHTIFKDGRALDHVVEEHLRINDLMQRIPK